MTTIEERIQSELSQWANANSTDLFLNERSYRELAQWFSRIEEACRACGFLEGHYAVGAIIFIESEDLARAMREKQEQFLTRTPAAYWIWDDFKEEIRRTILAAQNGSSLSTVTLMDRLTPDEIKQRLYNWVLTSFCYPLFKGQSKDLNRWFLIVERACRESGIPLTQHTEAALLLIFEEIDLAEVMQARQRIYLQTTGEEYWDWPEFKQDIRKVVAKAERLSTLKFWGVSAGVGLMAAGSLVVLGAGGILLLNVIGFTSGGVAAGSLAALIQSVFYGAATGGIFSFFQMIGATAVLPAVLGWLFGGTAAIGSGMLLRRALTGSDWRRTVARTLARLRLITNPT